MTNEENWQPLLDDVQDITNSNGVLISKARQLLFEKFGKNPISVCKDKYGVIAYEYHDLILCAKDYVYGNIVSCHKDLVKFAKEKNKQIVMFINKTGSFYQFEVDKILREGIDNKRGGEIMINFEIKLGRAVK